MGPKKYEILRAIVVYALRAIDMGLIMLSFGLGAIVGIKAFKWTSIICFASKVSLSSCVLFAVAMLLCYAVFSLCGLYQSKRMSKKRDEVVDVLRAMAFSTAFLWLEGRLFSISVITPQFPHCFLDIRLDSGDLRAVPASLCPRNNSKAGPRFAPHSGAREQLAGD